MHSRLFAVPACLLQCALVQVSPPLPFSMLSRWLSWLPPKIGWFCTAVRPPHHPPFYGALHLMTFNINGMFTKIVRGKKKVRKYAVLSKYLSALSVDFACIQEHHITSPGLENTLAKPQKHVPMGPRHEPARQTTLLGG